MENLNSKLRPETRTKIKNETKMSKDKMRKDLGEKKNKNEIWDAETKEETLMNFPNLW